MSTIEDRSQNVEQEQHANANNTTVSEDALTAKGIFESCQKNKTKPHGFSKAVAEAKLAKGKIGWAGALVLRYLSFMSRVQGQEFKGREWVRTNLDHIASHYSYLSRAGVDKAITRLVAAGAVETKNLNVTFSRPSFDRTRWYHVPEQWMNMADKDIRYFYAPLASKIGVPAAVIHSNFMHWIDERKSVKEEAVCKLMPAVIETLQPFSNRTIKRAIETLQNEGLIVPVHGKQCLFADSQSGPKVDESGPKVDIGRSKVDKGGPKVDNNSYCSSFVDNLKECSKERFAVAAKALLCVETNKGYKNTGLEHIEFLSPFETCVTTPLLLPETRTDTFTNCDIDEALAPQIPIVHNFARLHSENQNNRLRVAKLTKDRAIEEMFRVKTSQLTAEFFYKLGKEVADDLYDNASDDEVFEQLLPIYRAWFKAESQDSAFFEIFYYGVFECIVGAFRYRTNNFKNLHPITCFISAAYDEYCIMLNRAEKRRLAAIEEENAELHKEFASIDQQKEWMHDLSPAEKTRVFKQGLYSRNKIGWICLGGERKTDQIVINSSSLRDVERLFELNPDASAGNLLQIMDQCMHLHATYPPVPKKYRGGCKWHARMGHKLSVFTKHLETIIRQLGVETLFTRLLGHPAEDLEEIAVELEMQEAA